MGTMLVIITYVVCLLLGLRIGKAAAENSQVRTPILIGTGLISLFALSDAGSPYVTFVVCFVVASGVSFAGFLLRGKEDDVSSSTSKEPSSSRVSRAATQLIPGRDALPFHRSSNKPGLPVVQISRRTSTGATTGATIRLISSNPHITRKRGKRAPLREV